MLVNTGLFPAIHIVFLLLEWTLCWNGLRPAIYQSIAGVWESTEPVSFVRAKILDANDWLNVQVHPDDAYGMEHEGELRKTECCLCTADEGGEIIYITTLSLRNCDDRSQAVGFLWPNLLLCISGTMHAIGSGMLILKPSNQIRRIEFDFDHKDDQEIYVSCIEQSIDVLNLGLNE